MIKSELLSITYRGEVADLFSTGYVTVSDHTGKLLYHAGNPDHIAFARSCTKLIQVLPVIESGATEKYGISESEISTMCSSHHGEPLHQEAVMSILKKADLPLSALQCGVHYPYNKALAEKMKCEGIEPSSLTQNCSGKHSGMLICSKHLGDSLENYYELSHPHQQRILQILSELCNYPVGDIQIGIDGCGVPVHAMPMQAFSTGYAKLAMPSMFPSPRREAIEKMLISIEHNPVHISGTDTFTTRLNTVVGDRIVGKLGAAGFYTIGVKGKGIGIAVKSDSGITAMTDLAVMETLRQLELVTDSEYNEILPKETLQSFNHKGEIVGETRAVFTLNKV